jgi:HEPN domain-containing protein
MASEAKIQETLAWLQKAYQDLQSAKWLLSSPDSLFNAVGFHCQQAAEKSLKGFLTWHDEPFEKNALSGGFSWQVSSHRLKL